MFDGWWLPPAISQYATEHDVQFVRTLAAAAIIFVAAHAGLGFIAWRYRSGALPAPVTPTAAHSRAEIPWTLATAILFLGLLAMGARTWASVQFTAAPANAESVQVLARQFAWNFRYPGEDGRFGRTDIRLINDAASNPFGIDEQDAYGKDDIVSATLRIPAGRPVKLALHSLDVIHSFFVRELRIKQDLVPGMETPLHFRADVAGTYELPCAELCGLGHHQMRSTVIVMPPAEYEMWKREQAR